ncbi:unnamed protein product [Paramecium sonneborni]|uniref:Uncharacterized protein n=1 Tax=Paramecium sonneborni TaxID=65129 RepID=A0A8S1Q144_9CILI|nr:unnamed protein product [Paramecium sonneborni]
MNLNWKKQQIVKALQRNMINENLKIISDDYQRDFKI